MTERILKMKFENFRGLPSNQLELKGRNLFILGSNGKGKSGVVDGVEYVFSRQIARFLGEGTGTIKHDAALQHVLKNGPPSVEILLAPSNKSLRTSTEMTEIEEDSLAVRKYLELHTNPGTYILRRAKILEFIGDTDADRYKKFVDLLGITAIDRQQRALVDAEKRLNDARDNEEQRRNRLMAQFFDPSFARIPVDRDELISQIASMVSAFKISSPASLSDLDDCHQTLISLRPTENRDQIDKLTKAIIDFETPTPIFDESKLQRILDFRIRISDLQAATTDAPRRAVIENGLSYLEEYGDELACPLCEVEFQKSLPEIISRLNERSEALEALREAEESLNALLVDLQTDIDLFKNTLTRDLTNTSLISDNNRKLLEKAEIELGNFEKVAKGIRSAPLEDVIEVPEGLQHISAARQLILSNFVAEKTGLVSKDATDLERAIHFVEKTIKQRSNIDEAETKIVRAKSRLDLAVALRDAFSKAREVSIQTVFDQIASTVLDLYKKLHVSADETSECTGLELKSTARAAAGGLRLAIDFLNREKSTDARAFLSEGHLDSLGLCLFLATVKVFNQPGTLLVLDDVLTSVDENHRRRVGEVLLRDFSDFQIIMTTHDPHWNELMKSSVSAFGVGKSWKFIKFETWDLQNGPSSSEIDGAWGFIDSNLNEASFREIGGALRQVFEDFLKRVAEKIGLKLPYRISGTYTSGDFVNCGIADKLREKLIEVDASDDVVIRQEVASVFGQANLINDLSHDTVQRLRLPLADVTDFVEGLKNLTKRCERDKLIKGR